MVTAWLRSWLIVRRLRRTPHVAIADHDGPRARRVVGDVIALESLPAPISGRPCVCYQIEVEVLEPSSSGDGTQEWRRVIDEHGGVPFLVRDASGRARVDPTESEITIRLDHRTDESHDGARRYLLFKGHSPMGQQFRLREGILAPGVRVAVAGTGVRVPDVAPPTGEVDYRRGAGTILAMSGSRRRPLFISADAAAAA